MNEIDPKTQDDGFQELNVSTPQENTKEPKPEPEPEIEVDLETNGLDQLSSEKPVESKSKKDESYVVEGDPEASKELDGK